MTEQVILNEEEQKAMNAILTAGDAILAMGLKVNQTEFVIHVHGLQSFVTQHMLHRLEPRWSAWFEDALGDDDVSA